MVGVGPMGVKQGRGLCLCGWVDRRHHADGGLYEPLPPLVPPPSPLQAPLDREGAPTLPLPLVTRAGVAGAFYCSPTSVAVVVLATTPLLSCSHLRAVVGTLLESRVMMAAVVIATTGTVVAVALLPSPYAVRLIPVAVATVVAIKSAVATRGLALVALAVVTVDCRLINAVATLLLVIERCCCRATSVGTVALATLFAVVGCDSLSFETWRAFAEKQLKTHLQFYDIFLRQ